MLQSRPVAVLLVPLVSEPTAVQVPRLLVLRSSLYRWALATVFQLSLTLSSSDDVTLSPLGAGASGYLRNLDTFEDALPKVVE